MKSDGVGCFIDTAAAYTAYLQNFGSGAHVSEASQRLVALNESARKAADEKAWADAEKAGTAAAYTAYIQNFGGGAHVAEARQRVSELSRKEADDKAASRRASGHATDQVGNSSLRTPATIVRACLCKSAITGSERLNLLSARGIPPSSTGSASAMVMNCCRIDSARAWSIASSASSLMVFPVIFSTSSMQQPRANYTAAARAPGLPDTC